MKALLPWWKKVSEKWERRERETVSLDTMMFENIAGSLGRV